MILKSYVWEIDIPYSPFFIFTNQDSSISENQRPNPDTSDSIFSLIFYDPIRRVLPGKEYNLT